MRTAIRLLILLMCVFPHPNLHQRDYYKLLKSFINHHLMISLGMSKMTTPTTVFHIFYREGWEAKALLDFYDAKMKAREAFQSRGRGPSIKRTRGRLVHCIYY